LVGPPGGANDALTCFPIRVVQPASSEALARAVVVALLRNVRRLTVMA
jgi:hypothetical protein